MSWGYVFAVISLLFNVASQQFFSSSLKKSGAVYLEAGWVEAVKITIKNPSFWLAAFLLSGCCIFWALTLSQLSISRALPIMALLFLISPLVSTVFLGDSVSGINIAGFVLLVLGVFLSGLR